MEEIKEKAKELCADFNTISAEKKIWTDSYDSGVLHESTGKYVTESTKGFFPSKEVPAYKLCTLISALVDLKVSKNKDFLPLIDKRFHEALWEGFSNPTNSKTRAKKDTFRVLRKDVSVVVYNETLADIYDLAVGLLTEAQKNKDKFGEQVFGSISNLACICSDTGQPPYSFKKEYQSGAIDFIESAINLKFTL